MAHYIDTFPGREITLDGVPYSYFGGTAYLGLQELPEFQNLFIKNVQRFGTNYGASRKSNVRISIFDVVERYLAQMVGSESCISFSSGYLAGQFLVDYFQNQAYELFYAPNTHSALYRNTHKTHSSYSDLNQALKKHLCASKNNIPVLFLDSIDFSGANYPDFEGLKSLPLDEIIIVADDSHGIGVIGENGQGVFRTLEKLHPKELFICSSLGKGFGIQAGAIFGNKKDLALMTNTAFFGGASPASPAAMSTVIQAEGIYKNRRAVLTKNLHQFIDGVYNLELFDHMKEHPTFSFQDQKLVAFLKKHHIIVTDFNYPNENSKTMSRIVLSANHTSADIEKITTSLNNFHYE